MKKIPSILLILCSVCAYSQTIDYGITAGLGYTNLSGNGTIFYPSNKQYSAGFHAGCLMDIGYEIFSIQPSILFTTVGGQAKDFFPGSNGTTFYIFDRIVLDYVEIPVNFLFKIKAGSGGFFIGGGPYAAFAISGKTSMGVNKSDGPTDNLKFVSNYPYLQRFDYGLNALMGYRLNLGLAFSVGYGHGVTDIYNTKANNRNQGFNVSVSYFF